MKTKIVISAVNLVEGGPLTILRSCLKALNDYSYGYLFDINNDRIKKKRILYNYTISQTF